MLVFPLSCFAASSDVIAAAAAVVCIQLLAAARTSMFCCVRCFQCVQLAKVRKCANLCANVCVRGKPISTAQLSSGGTQQLRLARGRLKNKTKSLNLCAARTADAV